MKPRTNLTTFPTTSLTSNGHDRIHPNTDAPAVVGFLAARELLEQRCLELEAELDHIRHLLLGGQNVLEPAKISTPAALPLTPQPSRCSNRGLATAVAEVLAQGPLSKEQIIEHLLARKFEFFGKPKPALDAVLYSKKIRREGKLFALATP